MKLYEIPGHYAALQERAEEGEDVAELLAEIDEALEQKARNMLYVMRGLEADADALADEEARLKKKREAITNNAERLRRYLRDAMLQSGVIKIKCGPLCISLRDGPPKAIIKDIEQVPPELKRTKTIVEPDKLGILARFKSDGEVPPGCDVVRESFLVIK